ncbi:IS1380 family transposase [Carboxylicivirga marina]|uniref:IS1380 family transposase n=1 Tax=Carboxylicivirga marina TaxID=2800988 RepID=A0ABS1HQU9_9BACT|nr:IS1380 family transposase [Carboxylicivirga marina]MBK3519995.1 IS1380 family transposase [Carboxylicivirga marina]
MGIKITKIGVTKDKISARGGLPLFLRYIEKTGLYRVISSSLINLIFKNNKGLQLNQFLKQMFAFCMDGTNTAISHFDQLKTDEGYAALLENTTKELASSHQTKRFFMKLSAVTNLIFNKILHELFIWRLKINCPKIITLGIDTMVLDNDDAQKREGCETTYKKKKGFQPLHICWGPFLIDVLFRKGSAHSNHGNDYTQREKAIVKLIRNRYSEQVPIILCADSGFADQKAYEYFEDELDIHYITTSKIYADVKEYVKDIPSQNFCSLKKNKAVWGCVEFGNKLKSWKKFRRCIFTKLNCEESGQYVLDFSKPDNVIYTNIGNCKSADDKLRVAGGGSFFLTKSIIQISHSRGADELIHRSIKELATKEQLPFKSFGMNRAYYFMLVITHFIFEAYKQDVTVDIVPITTYPNTFRRKLIDFAAKITSGSRYVKLNVSRTIHETINFKELWKRCQSPPPIQHA